MSNDNLDYQYKAYTNNKDNLYGQYKENLDGELTNLQLPASPCSTSQTTSTSSSSSSKSSQGTASRWRSRCLGHSSLESWQSFTYPFNCNTSNLPCSPKWTLAEVTTFNFSSSTWRWCKLISNLVENLVLNCASHWTTLTPVHSCTILLCSQYKGERSSS